MRSLEAHRTVRVQEGAAGRAPPRVKATQLVVRGLLRLLFRVRAFGLLRTGGEGHLQVVAPAPDVAPSQAPETWGACLAHRQRTR
jgi:hypothetical protein